MHCPKDSQEMFQKNYEKDVEVDICSQCGGIWLDVGELEAIQDIRENDYTECIKKSRDFVRAAGELAILRQAPLLNCPHCNVEMARREYGFTSQILIDVCPECQGIWLDPGELQQLEIFFERNREMSREKGILAGLVRMFRK